MTMLMPVLLSLVTLSSLQFEDRPRGTTPRDVKGDKLSTGIVVTAPQDGFTIEIPGKSFKALSGDRLVWAVDTLTIELLVASPSPLLPDSASALQILQDYRGSSTGANDEPFSTPRGLSGLLWNSADRATAAVVAGRRIVVLTASKVPGAAVPHARSYVKSAVSTVRLIADTRASPRNDPPIGKAGTALDGQIQFYEALLGKGHVAVVSGKLATERDKSVAKAVVLDHDAVIDLARFLVGIGHVPFTVSVFDGRQAHAVNISGYDFKTETFEYWDPWGKGSFLERENNAAKVAARPHPSQPRIWLLSFDEMERILHSMVLPEEFVVAVFRTCTLAAGSGEQLVATYRALQAATPALEELAPEQLERDAQYMMVAGKADAAAAFLAARLALHPTAAIVRSGVDENRIRMLAAPMASSVRRNREPQLLRPSLKEDFFTFFHLQKTGSQGAVASFRPTSEKFKPLVEVKITTRPDDAITTRELRLDGAFVSDQFMGIFARDIARSFLRFSVDRTEAPDVKDVVDELSKTDRARVPIPGARRRMARVPAMPSIAYLTYIGQHPQHELVLPASVITLRNVPRVGGRDLFITVTNR